MFSHNPIRADQWTHHIFLYQSSLSCRFRFEDICVLPMVNHSRPACLSEQVGIMFIQLLRRAESGFVIMSSVGRLRYRYGAVFPTVRACLNHSVFQSSEAVHWPCHAMIMVAVLMMSWERERNHGSGYYKETAPWQAFAFDSDRDRLGQVRRLSIIESIINFTGYI